MIRGLNRISLYLEVWATSREMLKSFQYTRIRLKNIIKSGNLESRNA